MSLIMLVTLTACGGDSTDGGDSTGTGCEAGEHSWDAADCDTPKTCTECGATEGAALGHSYTVADKDATHHWKKCSVCGTTDNSSKTAHSFDDACDTDCNGGCGYERSVTHSYTVADKDETYHWTKCSVCGTTDESSKTEHSFDDECDADCNGGCGYERTITHDYTVTDKDATHHWKKCSVCGTPDNGSKTEHSFDDACDTDCNGGCGYERTAPHSYTNVKFSADQHWAECSLCDAEQPDSRVGHTYEGTVTLAPTTFETGKKLNTCACTRYYEEILPATKSLKLLAIGNSFSEDAFKHLYIVCKDAGIEELVLGNLYIGGCSLEKHYTQMSNDTAAYIFWISDDTEKGMVKYNDGTKTTAKFGLEYTDWDYITIQQNSANSGMPDSYEWLDDVIAYVNQYKTNKDAKLFWHMTWAYQSDSMHASFPNYDSDQLKMYNAILSCVQNKILTNSAISGVIPSGTAIQNLRNSHLGDTLTRDGYHLSYGSGRYTASLTYLAAITGYDISKITATPSEYEQIAEHLNCIKEGVANAIAKPYEITPSTDYPYVAPPEQPTEILGTTLSPLTQADRDYLTSKGYDPDKFMLLDLKLTVGAYYNSGSKNNDHNVLIKTGDLAKKYIATQIFTRNELPNGTLIRNDGVYKYRPDAWVDIESRNTYGRPANVTESGLVEIDDAWWVSTSDSTVSYKYRAFNIYGSNATITEAEAANFRIYVPVATKSELTEADRSYLSALGVNPNKYMVLDYTYTLHGYYNASNSNPFNISKGSSALHKEFICTNEKFTRYDIPLGSIIYIPDTDYRYRAEGWITPDQKVESADRPGRITTQAVTVDVAWWADWGYRAFNIQTKNSAEMADPGEKVLLRIYVPVEREYIELNEEDKTYLEGLGLNPDEYKVLNFDYKVKAFYDASSNGSNLNSNHSTLSKKFIGTDIFTKEQLTNGSVIRITEEGYQYRPEGWVALDQKVNSSDRPKNVSTETVIIDDAWWGDWNYRGFNISATDSHAMTEPEAAVLRIYVKVK